MGERDGDRRVPFSWGDYTHHTVRVPDGPPGEMRSDEREKHFTLVSTIGVCPDSLLCRPIPLRNACREKDQ